MFQIISERFFMPLASPNKMIYWKTSIPFQMYQMDLNVLKKYESYGKKLTQNDRKRLCDMMESIEREALKTLQFPCNVCRKLQR